MQGRRAAGIIDIKDDTKQEIYEDMDELSDD
jgi:hypothetical protein